MYDYPINKDLNKILEREFTFIRDFLHLNPYSWNMVQAALMLSTAITSAAALQDAYITTIDCKIMIAMVLIFN